MPTAKVNQERGAMLADNIIWKRARFTALGALAAAWLATSLFATAPVDGSTDEQTVREELKGLEDPTILLRRAWLDTEWNKYRDDSNNLEETLGGLWAWRVSSNQEWAVRLKLPYEWHIAGNTPGDTSDHGLGDMKLATGTACRLSESWRAGGGLELRMPTHSDDLGDDDWRLQEFGAVAWDVTGWLTLSPSAEYNHSVAEVHGGAQQNYLETYFPATVLLPHQWSATARYEAKVDFENGNYVTQSAKLLVAKQFDTPPLGLALSIKKSFDGGEKQFQVNFVISYYFR